MKFIVNKASFIKDLAVGGSLAGRSKAMPILDSAKICVNGSSGEIISSNLESTIHKRFDLSEPADGSTSFCIEYDTFSKVIKSMPAGDIAIDVRADHTVSIVHANGMIELPISDASAFPADKEFKAIGEFDMDGSRLLDWVGKALDFAANDEFRLIMNCMYLYRKGPEVGFCATDAHSLITDSMSDGVDLPDVGLAINRFSLPALCNVAKLSAMVRVSYNAKDVCFSGLDGTVLYSKFIEGAYPNFKAVIPNGGKISLTVDKEAIKNAIIRSTTCMNKATCDVTLFIGPDTIQIEAYDMDFNKKSVEHVECRNGGVAKVRLNANKLLNCIGAISSQDVNIIATDHSKPVVLKDSSNSNKTVLLMPMTD